MARRASHPRAPSPGRASAIAWAAWSTCVCLACSPSPSQRRAADRAAFTPAVSDPARVVARVDGVPIVASDVRAQVEAAAREGKKLTRRAAVEQLVRLELLAREALRRGLARSAAVAAERKRALAALMTSRWRAQFTPAKIPMRLVRRAYLANLSIYRRPVGREVTHIVVLAKADGPNAKLLAAARHAKSLRAIAASGKLSRKEFKQLPTLRAKQAKKKGLTVRVEDLVTARRGTTVRPFADATFALAKPGDVSKVVRTRFGFHVIYLAREIPGRDDPLARVEDEVRKKVFEQARRVVFVEWLDKLLGQHQARLHDEVLAAAMKRPKTARASKRR